MFAVVLLAGGSHAHAADTTMGTTKVVEYLNQIKMKSSNEESNSYQKELRVRKQPMTNEIAKGSFLKKSKNSKNIIKHNNIKSKNSIINSTPS